MLFTHNDWVSKTMNLTERTFGFEIFLFILGTIAFVVSYTSEKVFFLRLAKWIGILKVKLIPKSAKKKKQYKLISEAMAIG